MVELVERRECTRTSFFTEAIISTDSNNFRIEVELLNISISGMFVETDESIDVGSCCKIQIIIQGNDSCLILDKICGEVVRKSESGIALRFTSNMEWFVLFKIYTRYAKEKKI